MTIDESSGEVERAGARMRLQEKSLQVLLALCERPGEVVSREELVRRLWVDANVHVDYTAGLNTAVNRLRVALGDSAESPRYVETIPKKGYRLMVPCSAGVPPASEGRPEASATRPLHKSVVVLAIAALVFTAGWWTIREGARTQRAVVAVLPFRDLSNPPAPRLADGVTEEMITTLASIAPEQVGAIARTSAFRYRDTNRDLAEIGRELGVSYAMEGTVQAAGDRVRISARLVRIDARSVVWAESYDVDRRDLLTTERLVAEQVARAVYRRLTPRREPAPPDPAAHERVMEARYLARRGSRDELQRAVALYLDAVQREPGYAEAHADWRMRITRSATFLARATPRSARSSSIPAAPTHIIAWPSFISTTIAISPPRSASSKRPYRQMTAWRSCITPTPRTFPSSGSTIARWSRSPARA